MGDQKRKISILEKEKEKLKIQLKDTVDSQKNRDTKTSELIEYSDQLRRKLKDFYT